MSAVLRDDEAVEMHRVSDVQRIAKIGVTKIYSEIAAGRLKAVKLGRATRVVNLREYLRDLPSKS